MYNIWDSKKLPQAVFNLFFNRKAVTYKGKLLKTKQVMLKAGGTIKKIKIGDYVYLEQNPHTSSSYASAARNGKKIMWIIYSPSHTYVGRVVDGKVTRLDS